MEGDTAGKHQNSLRAAEAMRRFCHRLTSVFFALPPFKPLFTLPHSAVAAALLYWSRCDFRPQHVSSALLDFL